MNLDQVTIRNFRCFGRPNPAELAPLTLLVGENSTGKTSFLAMIRALWDVAYANREPDFMQAPYDLGSFEEIIHDPGPDVHVADSFEGHFRIADASSFSAIFKSSVGSAPVPWRRRVEARDGRAITVTQSNGSALSVRTRDAGEKSWRRHQISKLSVPFVTRGSELAPLVFVVFDLGLKDKARNSWIDLVSFASPFEQTPEPFAGAPVRSKVRRTYETGRPTHDPEGDSVPRYLANLSRRSKPGWDTLKGRLEEFASEAGLFDGIQVAPLGGRAANPFQIEIMRRDAKGTAGGWRNLIDMGYGVSQVLPVVTEILREDAPSLFLLQQPEVHLHPSAQAALGTLFCEAATQDHQLIVETHSDYLINRVRMDVRDKRVPVRPEDVSILYFERDGFGVQIHSLRVDEAGNLLNAPPSYGRFFLDETNRSLGY